MKKMNNSKAIFLFFFSTFFFSLSSKSQAINACDSLIKVYEKSSILLQDRKYVINGESFKMGFGQSKIGKVLKKSPMAYAEFELFKKLKIKATAFELLGLSAAATSLIFINKNTDQALYTGLTIVGIGCLSVAIPIRGKSKKHFQRAVWIYNRDLLKN
jgi:hypothetical protein